MLVPEDTAIPVARNNSDGTETVLHTNVPLGYTLAGYAAWG